MNITYVVGSFPKLSETFILDQITYLIDQDHEVNIIASRDPMEATEHAAVAKYRLRSKTTYLKENLWSPGFELDGEVFDKIIDSDLIHAHFAAEPASIAMELALVADIPFIFTAHAYDIFIDPDVERLSRLAKTASSILTISKFNEDYLANLLGEEYREKIEIVRCGIDTDKFQPHERSGGEQVEMLTCGRLVEKKGIEFAIRAMKTVAENAVASLKIIGEGPLRDELSALIIDLELEHSVQLLGAQNHEAVLKFMKDSEIFLLPSVTAENGDREGIPVSLLEAQASGVPVVSTIHSGIPEGVLDNKSGFLVPERDVNAIASKLLALIKDPQLRRDMGLHGRKFVAQEFNAQTEFSKLEAVMKRVIQKKSSKPADAKEKTKILRERLSLIYRSRTNQLESEVAFLRAKLVEKEQEYESDLEEISNECDKQQIDQARQIAYLHKELTWMRRHITWRLTKSVRDCIGWLKTMEIPGSARRIEKTIETATPCETSDRAWPGKVLYVLDAFPKLSETFVLNEIVELLNRGIEVRILALRNTFEKTVNRKVFSFDLIEKTRWVGSGYRKIYLKPSRIIHEYGEVDVVHSHFAAKAAGVAVEIAKILDVPVTVTAHAYEIFLNPDLVRLQRMLEKTSAVITPSEYNRTYLAETVGLDRDRIKIVRATIDADEFSSEKSRSTQGIGPITLICVGRLVEKKGVIYLIHAMKRVLENHDNVRLNIVGSGPLQNELKKEVSNLGLSSNVFFLGDQSNEQCIKLIEQSDIAVLPCIIAENGDRDVCPLTLQEASAMGLPVITTDVASLPELVTDGINGLLVPPKDVESLVTAITSLLDDPEMAHRMGSKGREKIEGEFNIHTQVDLLLKHWEELEQEKVRS